MSLPFRALVLLLAAGVVAAAPASPCVGTLPSVDDIAVSYLTGDSDATHRQEFVHISQGLADALGIASVDTGDDGENPNPQIRVRIQSVPADYNDISRNNAVFTVTAIVAADATKRIWVHEQVLPDYEESGQFKLFARTDQTLIPTPDLDGNQILDDILVRAFPLPVSKSIYTTIGFYGAGTTLFCEPSTLKSYLEKAYRRVGHNEIAVLAPHGGNIETSTSAQANRFASSYESLTGTPVNLWNVEGKWGNDQTDERWHITSTSLNVASYPALQSLLADGVFDDAVSFHGFRGRDQPESCGAAPDATPYEIIVGGGAPASLKCLLAVLIQFVTSEAIAVDVRDEGGDLSFSDACGHHVTTNGRDGTEDDNIVNRVAANGGLQIEQSKTVRDHPTYVDLIPDAVAAAFDIYLTDDGETDYCEGL